MAETIKYYGLCETCEHDATCTLRRCSSLKIIECEEFSIQPQASRITLPPSTAVVGRSGTTPLGLCVNCMHVATCKFPDARQNVQQCEEYMLGEPGDLAQDQNSRSAA
jgi:hypothetical protein